MNVLSMGDAARQALLARDGASLKADLHRLTTELSTGRVSDLGDATGGDYSALSDIRRSLRLNRAFATAISEKTLLVQGRQAALGRLATELENYAPELLTATASGQLADMAVRLANAGERFSLAVAALNTRVGQQSVLSADAPDQPALISADEMMDALRPLAAGAATAQDMIDAVDAWFLDTGGGYETDAWQGGDGTTPPLLLFDGETLSTGPTALDPAIRESLAGLALAALASEQIGPSASEDGQRAVVIAATERMQVGGTNLITVRAELGAAEARIEEAGVRTETTRSALEIELTRLTEADPYRTATELEALGQRLDSLYLLTARLSRLTLSEYLR